MRKSKRIRAVLCTLAIVLWFAAGLLVHVNAAFAEEQTGSLTLWCVKDEDIVANMHWQIYRVGHRVKDDYIFEGDFAAYRPTLGDRTKPMLEWDSKTVADAGDALKFKTIADRIPSLAEGSTDKNGNLTFPGLENGLYLVWGDVLRVGTTTYIPSAIFFEMRGEDAAVLNAYPKIVLETLGEEHVNYSVRKVWLNDEAQPWNRAASIVVERYRDNAYYDTITLSAVNDWTYQWEDEDGHEWFTFEREIPKHYSVSYEDNHKQYLIINTLDGFYDDDSSTDKQTSNTGGGVTDTGTTTNPDDIATDRNTTTSSSSTTGTSTTVTNAQHSSATATTTLSDGTTQADNTTANAVQTTKQTAKQSNSTTAARTVTTTTVTEEKAPQTGQLWWPVPILAVGGVVLLGFGMHLTKKDDNE